MFRPTLRCFGCCATRWTSPAPSTDAAPDSAAPAPSTLTAKPSRSCVTPVSVAAGKTITTIEGLSQSGAHPLQLAWIAEDVPQCGYCQSGQIMQAAALLAEDPASLRAGSHRRDDRATSAAVAPITAYAVPSSAPRQPPEVANEPDLAAPIPGGRSDCRHRTRPGVLRSSPRPASRGRANLHAQRLPAHRARRQGHHRGCALGDGTGRAHRVAHDSR